MFNTAIVAWKDRLRQRRAAPNPSQRLDAELGRGRDLHTLYQHQHQLPAWVTTSPIAMRCLEQLGPLAWHDFPERSLENPSPLPVIPYAAVAAAYLIKLEHGLVSVGHLRRYLVEHPELVWLCGFPLSPDASVSWGFDAEASLPTARHFTRLLRQMPNQTLQFLLDSSVTLIKDAVAQRGMVLGDTIALDTKHILAWVKENNPKTFVSDRFDKTKQPAGDPDCRLGCKKRHNRLAPGTEAAPATPAKEGTPASRVDVGEYHWGYASGIVVARVEHEARCLGEFVLAELTQPFDQADVSYFLPLMEQVERRLGRKPRFGALDAAFDAFYVYEYFQKAGGFAAVPFADRPDHRKQFNQEGLPLCAAGLPMPLHGVFFKQSHCLVPHECARYACPLLHSQANGQTCPISHKNWTKACPEPGRRGGCTTTLPTSSGTRPRHELDREGSAYQEVYRQRSADERINAQAVQLGIERPKLRNGQAIVNLNTLTYVLINLRALQRFGQRQADELTLA